MRPNKTEISIHWFRQDLRLKDNPSLSNAAKYKKILPIYILDDYNSKDYKMGSVSRWWLYNSLRSLKKKLNNNLSIYDGNPLEVFQYLINKYDIQEVCWNRCYEPWRISRDKKIKSFLESLGIKVVTTNGSLLWEPWDTKKDDLTPYRVFTPFYKRACLKSESPRFPIITPDFQELISDTDGSRNLDDIKLLPSHNWYQEIEYIWKPGEDQASMKLTSFLEDGISDYKEGRNFPSKKKVSQLSPYLHFGEISPNEVWYASQSKNIEGPEEENVKHFLSELGWREFSYNLLYYNQDLPISNLQKKFDNFPWQENSEHLYKWKRGLTGYPIVDAGMRELWRTGYMHNRVRMIVGSFLVKNLLLHWKHGERWFWDCLIDADLANNSASWQWIAGSGADAAPYYRIFNPITQGIKFDSDGIYTRKYIPELKNVPNKYLFNPWEAPKEILDEANVQLGVNYPYPVVDLRDSRERALNAFKSI
ncbi:MAG: deoxyribodipyrimidine photo-lyase [Rhodobiaceae bacterium]|nr:deoxyribodipyrimidine photo-lyase [Rhodobiaceae bacterium]